MIYFSSKRIESNKVKGLRQIAEMITFRQEAYHCLRLYSHPEVGIWESLMDFPKLLWTFVELKRKLEVPHVHV